MNHILGIDPGKSGAIACVLHDGMHNAICSTRMTPLGADKEYDVGAIKDLIFHANRVVIEKTQAMPGNGTIASHSMGYCRGMLEGICVALGKPYTVVHPKTWQKVVLHDLPKGKETKASAERFVSRQWPSFVIPRGPKSGKAKDGIADALCIAYYGLKTA